MTVVTISGLIMSEYIFPIPSKWLTSFALDHLFLASLSMGLNPAYNNMGDVLGSILI